jgi:hypothetical protein
MLKRNLFFLILSTVLLLTVLCSCNKDSIKDNNVSSKNINEESKSDIKRWNQLNSFDDIDENMIINNSIGHIFNMSASMPKTNGFSLKFRKFTGIDHYVSIDTVDECDIIISNKISDLENDFKAYLILSNGELIELTKDSNMEEKISYSLTEGENIVALAGYKAAGTFEIYIEPQEGVEIRQID